MLQRNTNTKKNTILHYCIVFLQGGDGDDDGYGFRIGMGVDNRRGGPGFSLKFWISNKNKKH